jgi:hypothetical protein
MANTHGIVLSSAQKPLSGVPDNPTPGLQLQFARQLYDRCRERHGEDHEQTRLIQDYLSALQKPRLVS